jgi:hypothetical protein
VPCLLRDFVLTHVVDADVSSPSPLPLHRPYPTSPLPIIRHLFSRSMLVPHQLTTDPYLAIENALLPLQLPHLILLPRFIHHLFCSSPPGPQSMLVPKRRLQVEFKISYLLPQYMLSTIHSSLTQRLGSTCLLPAAHRVLSPAPSLIKTRPTSTTFSTHR